MKPSLKKKWIERLETGKKARNKLRANNGGRCCLGHLIDIIDPNGWYQREEGIRKKWFYNGDPNILDSGTLHKVGMTMIEMDSLIKLNDHTPGFDEVIKRIERMK